MPQVGDVLEELDGAELLALVDELPIRTEDGEQLELAIDLSGLERLHCAMAGPAIVIRPDDGSVISRIVGFSVCYGKTGC